MTDMQQLLSSQPMERMARDGIQYVMLGTAHVSKESALAVDALLESESFDGVAIELDAGRFQAMNDPDSYKQLDLIQVFKSGKAMLVAANLALGAYQRRLAEQVGIEPGAEMMAADRGAKARNLPTLLIDRDVSLTLARCRASLGFWGGTKLISGAALSVFDEEEIAPAQIEQLKQGDLLKSTFGDFANDSPKLFEALIGERDQFMVAKLREQCADQSLKKVLVVIGAGHLAGMSKAMTEQHELPKAVMDRVSSKPEPSIWPKLIGWGITLILVLGMAWGFHKGFDQGKEMLAIYLACTAGGAFIGALLARAHLLSAFAGALSAPITVLHPALGSGMFSAGVELWLRKPTVNDFEALRVDLKEMSGWWKNRVSRVLLVFILTNIFTMFGTWTTALSYLFKTAAAPAIFAPTIAPRPAQSAHFDLPSQEFEG
jgi:pheromone shutdown-related protein TraB